MEIVDAQIHLWGTAPLSNLALARVLRIITTR